MNQVLTGNSPYEQVPFALYPQTLSRYFWLNATFTTAYKFSGIPNGLVTIAPIQLITMQSTNPGRAALENTGFFEFNGIEKKCYLFFLNERFQIKSIETRSASPQAIVLNLLSDSGKVHCYCGAEKDPFSPGHKEFYAA